MLFAHDTEAALQEVAELVNSVRPERIPDVAALDALCRRWRITGRRDGDSAELRAVRALRPVLRELWDASEDRVVEIVNGLLRDARALPQLVRHDGWDWHVHATSPSAPLATRLAVEAALAMLDLVRSRSLDRLRICALDDCEDVVVDLTKNRSRLYCSTACTNRAAVRAYRARKRAAPRRRRAR